MSTPKPALFYLGPQWFAPVMGWCGLSLAWHRGTATLGAPAHGASVVAGAVALLIFLAVFAASVRRLARQPGALAEDLDHPVRHAFAAAFPVSLILLATVAQAHALPVAVTMALWLLGLIVQLGVTAWVIARWLKGRLPWAAITPVMYIPIVGNILVPLAGTPLQQPMLSWAYFGIGAFFWPVVTAMLFVRQAQQALPDRLAPAWFILLAPPSVAGLSGLALGAPVGVAYAALGVATVLLLAVITRVPTMIKSPFAMPAWGASFPLAAFTALLWRCAESAPGLQAPALLMLALSSLVILGLSLATIKGLRSGTLLAPEPVATIAVQPAAT